MESMREMLKKNLARSLEALPAQERLASAWPVACGRTMAERGDVVGFSDGIVRIEVENALWLDQMLSMRAVLERELAKIAGVKIAGIHFEVKRFKA